MTFDDWHRIGMDNGWCGPAVCATHDGIPSTLFEDEEWAEGGDPCSWIVRLYEDEAHKQAVELNHSPSQWRKPHET